MPFLFPSFFLSFFLSFSHSHSFSLSFFLAFLLLYFLFSNSFFLALSLPELPTLPFNFFLISPRLKSFVFLYLFSDTTCFFSLTFFFFSDFPSEGPSIRSGRKQYQVGETAHLTCEAQHSSPATQLAWYINGEPVRFYF